MKMINDLTMFHLRAEKNYFGIASDLHCVSWRPVKEIVGRDNLLLSVKISDRYLPFQQITPMRRLAAVILEAL